MITFTKQLQYVKVEARLKTDYVLDELRLKGLDRASVVTLFRVSDNSEVSIGRFYLSPFPGCCGIVICHNKYLTKETRHTGLSQPVRELTEQVCKELGYTILVATTQLDNIPAVGNMLKSKYDICKTFTNKRTGNPLGFGWKTLT